MTLLLDIGNSRIKWQDSRHFTDTPTAFNYKLDRLKEQLDDNLKSLNPEGDVYIASVASQEVNRLIEKWIDEKWHVATQFLLSTKEWQELRNGYEVPELLGIDRWCALIGASIRYEYPFMVCDIGTAMTVDLVDHNGNHLGGFITPGLELMIHSLNSKTDINISSLSRSGGVNAVPTNTAMAVRNGCMHALAAMIDSVKRKYSPESICVVTGGHAEDIKPLLESDVIVDKNLIFHGIDSQTKRG